MDFERSIIKALVAELERQKGESAGALTVDKIGEGRLRIAGDIDLEAVAMAIAGTLAGGP